MHKLREFLPDYVYAALPKTWTKAQLANFLGQCDHETERWTTYVEQLNYNGPALRGLWPTFFTTQMEGNLFARKPECVGNRIYANLFGNGDELSEDGFKYRGRGALMLRGRANFEAFFAFAKMPLDSEPAYVTSTYRIASAIWLWNELMLNDVANDIKDATVANITKLLNNNLRGLANRAARVNFYYEKM